MKLKLTSGWVYAASILVLAVWVLRGFFQPLSWACVIAVATWPLYRRFVAHMPSRMGPGTASIIFTVLVSVFVLAPMIFAVGAMAVEAQTVIEWMAAVDKTGLALPGWLEHVPLVGARLVARWQEQLETPGAVSVWLQGANVTAVVSGAQSLGQFVARHLFIISFTILVLFFLYRGGDTVACEFRALLRHRLGERGDAYLDLAARALQGSVNGMVVVGLFDGMVCGIAYALVAVPHAAVWAMMTGLFAIVPFVGYVAVAALALKLAVNGAGMPALLVLGLGFVALFAGDKIVRPLVVGSSTRLGFVWVLMGCLGGFEVLGLLGVFVGPVVLTLAKELWQQRIRDLSLLRVARTAPAINHDA